MKLCAFSKSEILRGCILDECPLSLTTQEAAACPCRKRYYHVPPADLRVLGCEFPRDFRGDPIADPEAVTRSIRHRRARTKLGKAQTRRRPNPQEPAMNTTTATAVAEETARQQQHGESGESRQSASPATNGKSTALVKSVKNLSMYDRVTDPLDFISKMGGVLYNSKMFGCVNQDQGRALAYRFLVKREDPFDFVRRNDVIGGKVAMKSATMLADFRTVAGGSHRIIERTPERAAIELTLGRTKTLFEFAWAEAQGEDYVFKSDANNGKIPKRLADGTLNPAALKDNWSTPRRRMQMLWARVVSDAVRSVAPEINYGAYTPEELGGQADETREEGVIDAEFEIVESLRPEPGRAELLAESEALSAISPPLTPFVTPAAPPSAPPVAAADETRALLLELKRLKDELLSDEQYRAILDKRGVKTARDLPVDVLGDLVHKLREIQARKAAVAEQQAWAEQAIPSSAEQPPEPAGDSAGN